ncbi:Hypothetical protein I595_2230 [Croceitalea dokdonensis DOKDO 023]|uniref:Adhesin domain-containing protein n=1 Tax=Croceitalea dokdonensis DOKDO 023 TaxID=1300341 RepID=A0A0P7A5A6_9FLAO|nr:hypothetical protein [Croceitalea dokdonensis]KPM31735.1 Hypothetical protein I595_2230 [Croceitalea dokdonensis DOKDO 023]
MNRNQQQLCSVLLAVLLTTAAVWAQKQTKTFTERFNVDRNTVLALNTTHTDITFETWDKDEVEIIAAVVLEGATEEEAASYFKNSPFYIKGNSRQIDVRTTGTNHWANNFGSISEFNSAIAGIEPLFLDLKLQELPEMPDLTELPERRELSEIPIEKFDYDAYEIQGDTYLEEWTTNFKKHFEERYEQQFKSWGEAYERQVLLRAEQLQLRAEERANRLKSRLGAPKERMTAYEERRKKLVEERVEKLADRASQSAEKITDYQAKRNKLVQQRRESLDLEESKKSPATLKIKGASESKQKEILKQYELLGFKVVPFETKSNMFYLFDKDNGNESRKIKKSIHIKLPKSVRLKLDVKHGEILLADITENIDARLKYVNFTGFQVDGKKSKIEANYSPISISKWLNGTLEANYSKGIYVGEIENINLKTTASEVTIDKILKNARLVSDLGSLNVNSISQGFKEFYIAVTNGDLELNLPSKPFNLYLVEEFSEVNYPKSLDINKYTVPNTSSDFTSSGSNKRRDPSVIISAKYSEVTLKQ